MHVDRREEGAAHVVVLRAPGNIDVESWGDGDAVNAVCAAVTDAGLRCSDVVVEKPSDLDDLRDPGVLVFPHARHLQVAPGERVPIVTLLEERGIAFIGSGTQGQRSRRKTYMKTILARHGLPTPRWWPVPATKDLDLRFPVVVKPDDGGNSIGVLGVADRSHLEDLHLPHDGSMFAEEWMRAREYTIAVIGNGDTRTAFAVEVFPLPGEPMITFQCKCAGLTLAPVADPAARQRLELLAIRTATALSLVDWGRVDVLEDAGGGLHVIDVNAQPGIRPVSVFTTCVATGCAATYQQTVLAPVVVGLLRRGFAVPPAMTAAHAAIFGAGAAGAGPAGVGRTAGPDARAPGDAVVGAPAGAANVHNEGG